MTVSTDKVLAALGDLAQVEGAPLDVLVAYVVARYHEPLREALWRVDELATQVEAAGGDAMLAHQVRGFARNARTHMMKEQMVLFPAIRMRRGRAAAQIIRVLEIEHIGTMQQLEALRVATDDFRVPAAASAQQIELYERLVAVGIEMREHFRLEQDVLFRRALTP